MKKLLALLLLAAPAFADTTPNMSLIKPTPGVTSGPLWAQMLNDAFDQIDEHDHSSGKGVRVTPSGLNINSDLECNGNDVTELRSTRYEDQSATLAGADDLRSLFSKDGNLYWRNGSGSSVQVTAGSAVNNNITNAFSATVPGAYPYTISVSDNQRLILVDTSAPRTLNLPAATTVAFVMVKDRTGSSATNNITIHPAGSDTIDAVASDRTLTENYAWYFLLSDGVSNWSMSRAQGSQLSHRNGGTGLSATPTNGQVPVGNGSGYTLATLTGTSNQVTVTNGAGTITLATPQNLHTAATPTFGGLTLGGGLTYSAAEHILANTSDGADNSGIDLSGGGAATTNGRGAWLELNGNERASNAGWVRLKAGDVSGAKVAVVASASNGEVILNTNEIDRWKVDSSGMLKPNVDDTYDLGTSSAALRNLYLKPRTWSPTYTVTGAGIASTQFARYTRIGKLIQFSFTFGLTNSATRVRVTTPSTAATLGSIQGGACHAQDSGNKYPVSWFIADGGTEFDIYAYPGSFSPSSTIACTGVYEEN